mmetsp:Transcript_34577/g.35164  ORF Transcript_34577/g.35164 Transcript_34577/m.35164 type:complete len:101 (+) Transcript_34577:1-303(+)
MYSQMEWNGNESKRDSSVMKRNETKRNDIHFIHGFGTCAEFQLDWTELHWTGLTRINAYTHPLQFRSVAIINLTIEFTSWFGQFSSEIVLINSEFRIRKC